MNYVDLIFFDTANGPGFRTTLFVAGCTLNCKGCFNPSAHNFRAGKPFTLSVANQIFKSLENPQVRGISLLGGDPLEQKNVLNVFGLCTAIKSKFPDKDIWLWTGRTLEEIQESHILSQIIPVVDFIIEGRFVQELVSSKLPYRGSSNQRIIETKKLFQPT